jgi:hypothetical protein
MLSNTLESDVNGIRGVLERRLPLLAMSCVAVVALLLRAQGLAAGLPYIAYIDEGHVLHPVMTMLTTGTWDPGWYRYPSLTPVSIVLSTVVVDWILQTGVLGQLIAEVPIHHREFYDMIGPTPLIFIGRAVVMIHGVVLVCLCGLVGRTIGNHWNAGLFSMGLCAVTPALVFRSSIVAVDTLASTYFVMALLFSALVILKGPTNLLFVAGGASAALAFTSKYQAGAALGAVAAAVLLVSGLSISQRMKFVLVGILSFVLTSVIAMPALAIRHAEVLSDIRTQMAIYSSKSSNLTLAEQAIRGNELGSIWVLLFLVGCGGLFASRHTRRVAVAWMFSVLPLLFVAFRFEYQPFRNLLPVIAMGCVVVGVSLSRIVGIAGGYRYLVVVAVVSYGLVLGWRSNSLMERHGSKTDSRTEIADWLVENVGTDRRVLIEKELVFLPSELARLPQRVLPIEREDFFGGLEPSTGDVLVTGDSVKQEWANRDPTITVLITKGSRKTPRTPVHWRRNNQQIFVMLVP